MGQCLNYQPIIARREFFELEGIETHYECIVLSQLVYWASVSGFNEFYKTDEELSRETAIPISTLERIKKSIRKLPYIRICIRGIPKKTYYKIDPNRILEEIQSPYIEQCLQKPQKTQSPHFEGIISLKMRGLYIEQRIQQRLQQRIYVQHFIRMRIYLFN